MGKEIRYSEKAAKQLRKIFKADKKSARMIVDAIGDYAEHPENRHDVKVLKGQFEDLKRMRVGRYRVIFDENMIIINIYEIKHRQEAYHD
ncbi:MAG: hypothetical protein CVV44_12060 [Spirochaetae bacterium HGW-Spirochaetae-1]|jgi:mRNA interferase RelE/StbE|nr:MAG: hypothetical protein CVV44_12060 [Spirochaetae bacterium HGW-Spirochaetae-1]